MPADGVIAQMERKRKAFDHKPAAVVGDRFGRLVVLEVHEREAGKKRTALWRCDCGNEFVRVIQNVKRSKAEVVSCGCAVQEAKDAGLMKTPKPPRKRMESEVSDLERKYATMRW